MIEIKNLHIEFASGALTVPHWQVPAGAHALVLGQSGCGKSTLLNILGGLRGRINREATVQVCGAHPYELTPSQRDALRAQKIGFITQRNHLINAITVAENLRLALRLSAFSTHNSRGKKAEDALITGVLKHLNIANKAQTMPAMLSVGEAQRVAIARAVIKAPAILLADEPTSALDDANALTAAQMLLDVGTKHGSTVIIATHDSRIKHLFAHTLHLGAAL